MNSSDVIEDSGDESKVNNNTSLLDNSGNESFISRPSYEDVVEESFIEDNTSHNSQNSRSDMNSNKELLQTPRRNNSYILSSDEDENFVAITRSTRRIRKIASDSEDEFEHVKTHATNLSFTNHRSVKTLDSDEDDGEDSSTSLTETSNSLNFKEMSKSKEMDNILSSSIETSFSLHNNNENTTEDLKNKCSSNSSKPTDNFNSEENNMIKESINKSINESFRENVEEISSSSDQSDDGVISIISSDNEADPVSVVQKPMSNIATGPKLLQPTINTMVQNMSLTGAGDGNNTKCNVFCTAAEYANQSSKISNLRTDILKCKNILRTANLSLLPDKGALLIQRQRNLEKQLTIEEEKIKNMSVNDVEKDKSQRPTWEQLQTKSAYVVPNTFGKQAMNTYAVQKTLTMERLKNLHDSLAKCPGEDTLAEDPKGLKIELMNHQKRALAWLIWREKQKPSGGILADDMGLGKTLTMISLIVATKETELEDNDSESDSEEKPGKWAGRRDKFNVEGGTLVICPASLIRQWESEIENRLKRNLLSVELHHGNKRETKATRLSKYDVVITTYKLAQGEFEKKGPLYNIKWKRIILDEGHVIRNPKAQTSVAICDLKAKARWVLTGTPVHNKELDLYALLKFLRCSPFDDLAIWKRWVANKNAGGQDRLNTVITSILLRRTKAQLQSQGALQNLPEKKFEVIEVSLDSAEKKIYQKVLVFSRTLFIQFLRQRAEKNPEFSNIPGGDLTQTNDEEYNKMHKKIMQMHGNTEVKSHEILVLLLRLRQICCHPSLISSMLDQEDCAAEGIEEEGVDIELLDKLNNLNIDDETTENPAPEGEKASFAAQANKVLSTSNPVFAEERTNGKLRVIQKIIEEKVIPNNDKIIIVSQWTSMLNVIMRHLKEVKIRCEILDGKVAVHKRNDIVVDFNNPATKTKVLLLSLTAGGVGLNLIGANHLLLVDLHWNPQLESQAQDRIYRVGQKKTVYIYKIVTIETIEERIKALQDNKLSMASDILSGVRPGAGSKLSLDDLKMLFSVAG